MPDTKRPIKIIGCGAHGRVIADIARAAGEPVSGFIDDNPARAPAGISAEGPTRDVVPRFPCDASICRRNRRCSHAPVHHRDDPGCRRGTRHIDPPDRGDRPRRDDWRGNSRDGRGHYQYLARGLGALPLSTPARLSITTTSSRTMCKLPRVAPSPAGSRAGETALSERVQRSSLALWSAKEPLLRPERRLSTRSSRTRSLPAAQLSRKRHCRKFSYYAAPIDTSCVAKAE